MQNDRILLAALLFILLIVGANFIMYGVVRGLTRSGAANWMNLLRKSFEKPSQGSVHRSMEELRQKVEELQQNQHKT
jgi:hypothetical protein